MNKKQVLSQAEDTGVEAFVENQRWFASRVAFAELNVPGSNNDLAPWTNVTPQQAKLQRPEYDSRLRAGIWLDIGGPVLLLEGDSHRFRVDHPLTPGDPLYGRHPLGGLTAPNLTRIVVEGSTNPTEYLRLTVDPAMPQVFSWQRVPL